MQRNHPNNVDGPGTHAAQKNATSIIPLNPARPRSTIARHSLGGPGGSGIVRYGAFPMLDV